MVLSLAGVSTSFLPAAVQAPSSTRAAPRRLQATTPTVADSDAEAFQRITLARRATKHFDRRAVPEDLLKKVVPRPLHAQCLREPDLVSHS